MMLFYEGSCCVDKMEKRKIGIVTLYGDRNFGNKLQNYAVQLFFEKLGFECWTIPCVEIYDKRDRKAFLRKLCRLSGIPKSKAKKFRQIFEREKVIKGFSDDYIKLDSSVSYDHLPAILSGRFDYFVVGSDQVWHNWNNSHKELDFFFLKFAKYQQRLTISPSFGFAEVDPKYLKDYREGLNGFYRLTCREKQGADLIYDLTGKRADVLLDPTMLVEEKEWNRIVKKPDYALPDRYILLYWLGKKTDEEERFIEFVSREYNLEIVDVLKIGNDYYNTRPDEFLFLIKNAVLVLTNSFHACVFSILFEVCFIAFERRHPSKVDMSSRLDTLLNTFGLQERKYEFLKKESILNMDYSKCKSVLEKHRSDTKSYYESVIEELAELEDKQM